MDWGGERAPQGTATLNFEYDGSQMIGWNSTTAGAYNFTTMRAAVRWPDRTLRSGTTTTGSRCSTRTGQRSVW